MRSGYSTSPGRLPQRDGGGPEQREHPEAPAAVDALVDAGWEWSVEGEYVRALALFDEALRLGHGSGGAARIGMADQLCRLGRREEAEEVLAGLRAELDAAEQPDVGAYAEAAGLLEEHGAFAEAVEWCDAGLARCAQLGRSAVEAPTGALSPRDRLLMTRRAARREQGLPPDAQDEEARLAEECGLRASRRLPPRGRSAGRPLLGGRQVEQVVLYWPEKEFEVAAARWPSCPWAAVGRSAGGRASSPRHGGGAAAPTGRPGAGAGDTAAEHELHRRRVQHEAERLRAAGVAEVVLVSGSVTEYEEFAARTGRKVAAAETFAAYAVWRHREHPELSVRWPPPRNAPCWCGSADAYKACCGAAAGG